MGAALVLAGLAGAWVFGEGYLQRRVAEIRSSESAEVRFNWPVAVREGERVPRNAESWMPMPIRQTLIGIAQRTVSPDPFDHASLESARAALLETGWLSAVSSVSRGPGGRIDIEGEWRIPAAVVRHNGREYLVATRGEILRLPSRTPVARGSMPLITGAGHPPPGDAHGVVYGVPWPGGDVQAAIELARTLRQAPESSRIASIDASSYGRTGHLTLVTDTGGRVVWGSAPGELAPGEVPAPMRLSRLRQILAERFDVAERFIEIYTPVVLVDKTAGRQ